MPQTPLIIITHEFYPKRGGIATFVEEIANAAAESGLDVEVWAQANTADKLDKPWKFRLRRLPLSGSHDFICQLKLAWELIKCRRQLRHSVVYLAEPGPMLTIMWLQFLHAFRPKNIFLTFHGSEILKFHLNPLIRPLARRLIEHAKSISTLTNYTRDLLCDRFPEAKGKCVITPGALRVDYFKSSVTQRSASQGLVILTVGRLHPRKGQMQTLAALAALPAEQRANIEYWIVGTAKKGNYEIKLQQQVRESGLTVNFLGDISDDQLSKVYDQADIFALTSIDLETSIEGFGLVYLEASAHGLPIIAHDVGGVSEAVLDGETGLLIPANQPAELIKAFSQLISDGKLRDKLGSAGRKWARQNSWKQSAELLFATISSES